MGGAIGPGTLLLCVDGAEHNGLFAGRIYECVDLAPAFQACCRDGCADPGVYMAGAVARRAPNPSPLDSFCPNRFVPAGRRGDFAKHLVTEPIEGHV